MLITIFDRYGQARARISANDSSTQSKEIQGDNILTLSFTLYEYVDFDVNDWCEYEGERYWITERSKPTMKSTQEWAYDIKMHGIESVIKRFLVLNTTDGDNEPEFTLTAPPVEHMRLIVGSINDGMDSTTNWKVGSVTGTENIVIDYHGKYCDEALKELAEKVGVEWWAEGQTINLCRCEYGEVLNIGYGKGLTGLEQDTADNVKFYTRLFPVGSSRNIDPERYGHSHLMLPGGAKYVDLDNLVKEYGVIHHYEKDSFADIYPRRVGTVSYVRHEEKTDEDGNPFTIYYFQDNSLNFDPNSYMLPDAVIRVSFQEGSELAGLGSDDEHYFEVNYDSQTREFEIITIWPYDDNTQLPGGPLVPKTGDKYILWNLRMPDEYYPIAEAEFRAAVEEYNAKHGIDVSRYKGQTDHVWVEESGETFYIGRRVNLESSQYFPSAGSRKSRITKITRRVNLPSLMDLEISDALSTGTINHINDSITDAKNYTRSLADSISLPDIIRSWDETLPTDNNLFSARRSFKEFLSKNKQDRAKEKIIFEKGIETGIFEPGSTGGKIDGNGNAELLTAVVRQLMRSAKFVDGLTGEGWQLWIDGNGLSNLTLDKLTVRQVMTVLELLVEKIRSVGGQIVVSAANGKVKTVEHEEGFYKITFEQENTFLAHDLMRCQTFTGGSLKSYWVEVSFVDGNSVYVAEEEFSAYGSEPEEADECVLMGNTQNPLRQSLILISATEDRQPRIDVMDSVISKNFTNCLRARLGNLDGISDDWFPIDNQPHGHGLYSDNAYLRGTFLLVTGEDIKTKFEITEGKIASSVSALRQDFATERGYLNNPSFDDGLEKWGTENETVFFLAGNKWIWANKNVLSKKGDSASVTQDMGRTVVRIRNKYIEQKQSNLRAVPPMEEKADGKKEAVPVYLSFFYRCASPGKLTIGFDNVNKEGFENFNSFKVEEDIDVTPGYQQYTCNGLWNGTGDFRLSFTGDIYLYMLVLSTDKIESLTYKYRTLFEQSERLVKISAAIYDKDENALKETGLFVKPEGAGLYAQDNEGRVALIGVSVDETDAEGNKKSSIKLTADNIKLEGLVTANNNFKILEDGSIEARNGKFYGEITANKGAIGGFSISSYSLTSGDEYSGEMYLSSDLMRFMSKSKGDNYVFIGADVMPGSMGGAMSCPMRIEVNREENGIPCNNSGILIDVQGAKGWDDEAFYGSHALYINHGDIVGLRPRVRRKSGSFTLSKNDFTILTVGSGTNTITLPASPEEGEMHFIRKLTSNYTLQVGGSGHKIRQPNQNEVTSWTVDSGALMILIWDRVNSLWIANYMN